MDCLQFLLAYFFTGSLFINPFQTKQDHSAACWGPVRPVEVYFPTLTGGLYIITYESDISDYLQLVMLNAWIAYLVTSE